jgi:ferredoxin
MTNTAPNQNPAPLVDSRCWDETTAALRASAAKLLADGTVAAVVGYLPGRRKGSAMPAVVTSAEEAQKLVFSPGCSNNLALYLTRAKKEIIAKGKLAVVVKGCDLRAVAGLIGENQLQRDNLVILGLACPGVYGAEADRSQPLTATNIARKCRECKVRLPTGTDQLLGNVPELPPLEPIEAAELARLEAMTPQQRWAFWNEHFSRCIRCLACRQVCPFCFCEQCLCDRNRPQGVEGSPRPAGNTAWHIVRAMHLAGRCAGCAECERACPMEIPLNLLNRKMAQELKELYGYEAGTEVQETGPLTSYDEKDDQSFIK